MSICQVVDDIDLFWLSFRIDRKSPFFAQGIAESLSQRLVDWTYGGSNYAINTDGISLRNTPRAAFSCLPADAAAKSFVDVELTVVVGTSIIMR